MVEFSAGVRPHRIEWIQESTIGTTPSDPSWNLFSDNVTSIWDWEPDANTQTQRGVGDINPQGFFNGPETHEATFEYDLQQWFEDGSGNTVDAAGDFLTPSSDNRLRSTHTVVTREEHTESGGTDSAGRRLYTVGKGGHPSNCEIEFSTDEGSPITVTLTYQFEKIRQYDISQPSSSTTLDITNNSSNNSVDVTIEDEGASTSETNTVGTNSTVTTTSSFGDIDAVELSTDIDASVDVTDGSGTTFVSISGTNDYPSGEGDLGVPALGSGSHASAIGSSYEVFLDDSMTIPNSPTDYEFISGSLEVDTGIDSNSRVGTATMNMHATEFTYTWTASLAAPAVAHNQTIDYLRENSGTITWDAGGGDTIDGNNTRLVSPGSYTKEAGQGKLTMDNEFESESLTIST